MAGILNVIGLLATGIGLLPLSNNLFPPPVKATHTVKIGIGEGLNVSDSLGGNTPGVSLWTVRGEAIGGVFGTSKIVPDGNFISIPVAANATLGNVPAEYVAITNGGDDAICVAYVSVTSPAGDTSVFFGDTGYLCGADWYPSQLLVGTQNAMPKCIWIDRNGSNGLRFQGFGVHIPDFTNFPARALQYNRSIDTMCKSGPRFRMYETIETQDSILYFNPPLQYNPDGTDVDVSKVINNPGVMADLNMDLNNAICSSEAFKGGCPNNAKSRTRKIKRDTSWADGQLVISAYQQHSAREVCESSTSVGPDFVSLSENTYCDMTTRTVWDVCNGNSTLCCFDTQATQMRSCGMRTSGSATRTGISSKTYSITHKWGW